MLSHYRRPVHKGKDIHRVADMTVRDRKTGDSELPDILTIPLDQALARERRTAVRKGR